MRITDQPWCRDRSHLWRFVGWLVTRPRVRNWLIRRAQRRPYLDISSADDIYMKRWWLFNPWPSKWPHWVPHIRLHHIQRADEDKHLHDHPWWARSVILDGWYLEQRDRRPMYVLHLKGDNNTLNPGEFHRIVAVSPGGVWTLFITGPKQDTWGFLVDDRKIPWREYLGERVE